VAKDKIIGDFISILYLLIKCKYGFGVDLFDLA
jgi:hypothetical protein